MHQNTGQKAVTPEMLRKLAATARDRIRLESGGYRRDHLRRLPSVSRSPRARFALWDRRPGCYRRLWRKVA